MRRLPMEMLVAAMAMAWCMQAGAQHMPAHNPAPPPPPPGTTATPSPSPRAPGGGGPWGTATVDPRCATAVVCGPAQTAAPGGPSSVMPGPNDVPRSEKPRLGGPATAVEANRQQLLEQLRLAQQRLALMSAGMMEPRRGAEALDNELQQLQAGTHTEATIAASVRDRIAAVRADIKTFENARDDTTSPENRERYVAVIADLTRILGKLNQELADAQRRIAARTAELTARANIIIAENQASWAKAHERAVNEVAALRARLGQDPSGGEAATQMIDLMTE